MKKIEVNKTELIWDKILLLLVFIVFLIMNIECRANVVAIGICILAIISRITELIQLAMK